MPSDLKAIENEKIKKYYLQSTYILSRSLENWYSKSENKNKEPHIHIKIYDKVSREKMFEKKRLWSYEKLLSDQKKLGESIHHDLKFDDGTELKQGNDVNSVEEDDESMEKANKLREDRKRRRRRRTMNKKNILLGIQKKSSLEDATKFSQVCTKKTYNVYEELRVVEEEVEINEFDDLSLSTEIVPDELTEVSHFQDGREQKMIWNNNKKIWQANKPETDDDNFDDVLKEFTDMVKSEKNTTIIKEKIKTEKDLINDLNLIETKKKEIENEIKGKVDLMRFPKNVVLNGVEKCFFLKFNKKGAVQDIKVENENLADELSELGYVVSDGELLRSVGGSLIII